MLMLFWLHYDLARLAVFLKSKHKRRDVCSKLTNYFIFYYNYNQQKIKINKVCIFENF